MGLVYGCHLKTASNWHCHKGFCHTFPWKIDRSRPSNRDSKFISKHITPSKSIFPKIVYDVSSLTDHIVY